MGRMLKFESGGETFEAYLAESNPAGPGVIVLQEWWGLVGHIKDVADRFAAAGYTALAPDLYRGKNATEPDEAGSLMMALNITETELQLKGAVQTLQSLGAPGKVGVVGFCMGGQLAMLAACENEEVGACVNFYGIHPNVKPNFANLKAPILGLFAEHDAYASPEATKVLSDELNALGKEHQFHTYQGAHHAFFNDGREAVYSKEASEDAWTRVLGFFGERLG